MSFSVRHDHFAHIFPALGAFFMRFCKGVLISFPEFTRRRGTPFIQAQKWLPPREEHCFEIFKKFTQTDVYPVANYKDKLRKRQMNIGRQIHFVKQEGFRGVRVFQASPRRLLHHLTTATITILTKMTRNHGRILDMKMFLNRKRNRRVSIKVNKSSDETSLSIQQKFIMLKSLDIRIVQLHSYNKKEKSLKSKQAFPFLFAAKACIQTVFYVVHVEDIPGTIPSRTREIQQSQYLLKITR